jgi:hypothetical protein
LAPRSEVVHCDSVLVELGVHVKTVLSGLPELTALVGNRVFPNELPQATPLPAIVYTEVDDKRHKTLGGAGTGGEGMVQLDCYGRSYDDAAAVARVLEEKLAKRIVRARVGSGDGGTWTFLAKRKGIDDQTNLDRVSCDFAVWRW